MITTWFLKDDEHSVSHFPNIGASSSDPKAISTYLKCVYCFFLTSIAQNPEVPHVFFTNVTSLPLDSQDLIITLQSWGVEVRTIPLTYRVPPTWQANFRNQFYLYDLIDHFAENLPPDSWVLIADSDCVWYGTCARIAEATLKSGLGTMTINYPAEKVVNGLSREGMRDLMPIIDLKKPLDVPAYCAGEAIGLTSCAIVELSQQARSVFERILAHHQNDLGFVCEEAHMLSMLSADLTAQSGALNQLTKRIWTAQRYRSTTLADLNLDLWHLPAEKRSGFLDLYNHLKGTHEEWIRCSAGDRQERLKELMGVPTKSPTKSLKDFVRASARRFNQCVRK